MILLSSRVVLAVIHDVAGVVVVVVVVDAVIVVAIDDKKMKVDFCWKVVSYPVDVVELELSLLSSITLLVLLSLM